jgi:UPF0755 protein
MLAFLRMLLGCFLAALFIVAGAGGVFLWGYRDVTSPGPLQSAANIVIPPHTGIAGMTEVLWQKGVIRHPLTFKVAAEIVGRGGALKAGEYEFPAGASAAEIIEIIASGKTVKHRLTIPEGLTSAEIVALVKETPLLTGDPGPTPPEGSLLPETYIYSRDDTRESIIARMEDAEQEAITAAWAARRNDLPLASPQEAVILASLIEKEASRNEERAHIAAVFLNRLRQGMKLQSDPTVRFVLGGNGTSKFDGPLTRAELEINSPYNTYVVKGLPPGPICNPGKAALRDAVRPEQSEDLYFVADGAGGHIFAKTLADHNRNVATYLHGAAAAEAEQTPANPPAAPASTQTSQAQPHCRASPGHPCVMH